MSDRDPANGTEADNEDGRNVAIACQGGGSHTAFTAGVLRGLFDDWDDADRLVGVSGTSGGAFCALVAWYNFVTDGPEAAREALGEFWTDLSARSPVDAATNEWLVWGARVRSSGVALPTFSPYDVPGTALGKHRLRQVVERHVDFDELGSLCTRDAPKLIVGTVDINGGEFETFIDEAVTVDAVLASAAVPTLFEAVEIHGHYHWDGVFSQNPPVKDFLQGPVEQKPDEIWIVQINPQRREGEPRSLEEIADRRSELAGNLSLNQEIGFINQVNEWLEAGHLPKDVYRSVTVRRLELDKDLHYSTQLDRSPAFVRELMSYGESRADALFEEQNVDRTGT
ncbi:NTE family protein [Halogranum amylolyticum]|uniref:NTE family protein n=1 Tax=Halogranum amylolyticum TaxID=660520 RepID=A0A1H8QGD5_9EURY|nr:patatin-like phospholipase family protein [Halogranum amylolyticum]SEO53299.1 NTE family protein [Halogranum amylolyticum]